MRKYGLAALLVGLLLGVVLLAAGCQEKPATEMPAEEQPTLSALGETVYWETAQDFSKQGAEILAEKLSAADGCQFYQKRLPLTVYEGYPIVLDTVIYYAVADGQVAADSLYVGEMGCENEDVDVKSFTYGFISGEDFARLFFTGVYDMQVSDETREALQAANFHQEHDNGYFKKYSEFDIAYDTLLEKGSGE